MCSDNVLFFCFSYTEERSSGRGGGNGNSGGGGGGSQRNSHLAANANSNSSHSAYHAHWLTQVYYLTQRFTSNNFRDTSSAWGGVIQAFVLGFVVMGIFFQLSDSLEDIESRNGLLYIVCSMEYYISMIILVERYCSELKVFDRELQDELYQPTAYLTAHIISSMPLLVVQPLLYGLPIYFGCDLRPGFQYVVMFLCTNIMMSFIINGLVWMCVSINRDFTLASLMANTNFTFISLTAGFLVNYNDIPVYVKWVRKLSYCSYAYRILMSNEYTDRVFNGCNSPNPADCIQYDGNYVLDSQDIATNDYTETWAALAALCVGYHTIGYLCLHYIRHPVTGIVGGDVTVDDQEEAQDERQSVLGSSMSGNNINMHMSNAAAAVVTAASETLAVAADVLVGGDAAGTTTSSSSSDAKLMQQQVKLDEEKDKKNAIQEALLNGEDDYPRSQVKINIVDVHLYVRTSNPNASEEVSRSATTSIESPRQAPVAEGKGDPKSKKILSAVSATIQPGKLVALMGGSGSGRKWGFLNSSF
jgi:ABC-type multidrug transport system fused ATPase/permease subunit